MSDSGLGKPARIFIVEDNDPDVFLVQEALRAEGISAQIQRCHDGEEAIHALSQIREADLPDVVIIDLNLPKITGLEILKHARSLKQLDGVPVLILTSSRSRVDRDQSLKLGADAYIAKPSTLSEFLSTVGSGIGALLERKRKDAGAWLHHTHHSRRLRIQLRRIRRANRHQAAREIWQGNEIIPHAPPYAL